MKATNIQEDLTISLVNLSLDKRGIPRYASEDSIPKSKTWDLEEYICENPEHPEYYNYFNPEIDMKFESVGEIKFLNIMKSKHYATIRELRDLLEYVGFHYELSTISKLSSEMQFEINEDNFKTRFNTVGKKNVIVIDLRHKKSLSRLRQLYRNRRDKHWS